MKRASAPLWASALVCAIALAPLQTAAAVDAIEYYHAGFDHYFMTAFPDEAAALDSGAVIKGWTRTGQTFAVDGASTTGHYPVCRFFSTSFNPKSSHFYTANSAECAVVKSNPDWQYEGIAFYVRLPDAAGNCSSGTKVYRLYNNGQGAAPNHRYTTSTQVRATMMSQGWIPEGNGAEGVVFCTSAAATPPDQVAYAKTSSLVGGTWTFSYTYGTPRTDTFTFTRVSANTGSSASNIPYFAYGTNKYGGTVAAGWAFNIGRISMASPVSTSWDLYQFDYTGANSISGCYYFDAVSSNCTPLTGVRPGANAMVTMDIDEVGDLVAKRSVPPGNGRAGDHWQVGIDADAGAAAALDALEEALRSTTMP